MKIIYKGGGLLGRFCCCSESERYCLSDVRTGNNNSLPAEFGDRQTGNERKR